MTSQSCKLATNKKLTFRTAADPLSLVPASGQLLGRATSQFAPGVDSVDSRSGIGLFCAASFRA